MLRQLVTDSDDDVLVSVCRMGVPSEESFDMCNDGMDNDCNGLTGGVLFGREFKRDFPQFGVQQTICCERLYLVLTY